MPAGTSSACELEPKVLGLLPDVCLCDDVDDLREGTLTWSLRRNSLRLPGMLSPLPADSFWELHCCIIFRDDLLHRLSMYF